MHAARHGWDLEKDAPLFMKWAIHTGTACGCHWSLCRRLWLSRRSHWSHCSATLAFLRKKKIISGKKCRMQICRYFCVYARKFGHRGKNQIMSKLKKNNMKQAVKWDLISTVEGSLGLKILYRINIFNFSVRIMHVKNN